MSTSSSTASSTRSRGRAATSSAAFAGISREPFNSNLLQDIACRRAAAFYRMKGTEASLREVIFWYLRCSVPSKEHPGERELIVLWREDKSVTDMGRKTRRYSGFAPFQTSPQPGMEHFVRLVEEGVPSAFVGRSFFAVNKLLRGAARAGIQGVDLDVVNMHPRALARRHLAPELEGYVRDREARLAEVCAATGCSREAAKELFLVLLYGGGVRSWAEEHGVREEALPTSIAAFKAEQLRLRTLDVSREPELYLKCCQTGHDRPDVKLQSVLNTTAERLTVDLMEAAVHQSGGRVCSFEHDGIFVRCPPGAEAELVRRVQSASDFPIQEKKGPSVEEAWASLRLAHPSADWDAREGDAWQLQLEAIHEARRLGSSAHAQLARIVAFEREAYPGTAFGMQACFKHQGSGKYSFWDGAAWVDDGERGHNALLERILEILPRRLCEYRDADEDASGWSHLVACRCRKEFIQSTSLAISVERLLRHALTDPEFQLDGEAARQYLRFTNGVFDLTTKCLVHHEPNIRVSLCTGWPYHGSGLSAAVEHEVVEALEAWRDQEGEEPKPELDARLTGLAKHIPALAFIRSITASWEHSVYMLKHICRATFAMKCFTESCWTRGQGSNGKDSLSNLIATLLGEYFVNVPCEIITQTRSCDAPSETFASLKGKRVVCIREMASRDSVKGHVFKVVTDPKGELKCRRLYSGKELRYSVSWLLLVATNNLLSMDENSHGISRRVALMELPYKFCDQPKAANERQLDASIERGFEAGNPAFFFALMVVYRVFLEGKETNRVQPIPRAVLEATTAELRAEWEDRLDTFVATRLEAATSAEDASTAAAVREAFASTARLTSKDAAMRLASRGFLELPPQSWRVGGAVRAKRPYEFAFPSEEGDRLRMVRLRAEGPGL